MINTTQNYLALDLELNNAQDGSTPAPKIIQVGVAVGSYYDYLNRSIRTDKWYLDPEEPIFPFITELTGITDQDIDDYAVSHSAVAQQLSDVLTQHNCYINPVTWGGGDSTELLQEFKDRDIKFRHFGRRWIDVKTWYTLDMLAQGKEPKGGLASAMGKYKRQFKGTAHRADVDAANTLDLFFTLLQRQSQYQQITELSKDL